MIDSQKKRKDYGYFSRQRSDSSFVEIFRPYTRNVLDKKYIQNIFLSSLFYKVLASA